MINTVLSGKDGAMFLVGAFEDVEIADYLIPKTVLN